MHEQRIQVFRVMGERPMAKPLDEFIDVRGIERLGQRVESAGQGHGLLRDRQQMQVVVTEYRDNGVPERLHEAQLMASSSRRKGS
jgi:hypothetical protein